MSSGHVATRVTLGELQPLTVVSSPMAATHPTTFQKSPRSGDASDWLQGFRYASMVEVGSVPGV